MILIADGGSTKCDWVLLDDNGEVALKTRTKGLNPAVVPQDELRERIASNTDLNVLFDKVLQVDFYGAGCGTETPRYILSSVISSLFPNAKVNVGEDVRGKGIGPSKQQAQQEAAAKALETYTEKERELGVSQ